MEFSLHRQLKQHYAPEESATEVTLGSYRIDAVLPDGELVEIQLASLSAIRRKVANLLAAGHRVRVVKPVVARRRIHRQEAVDGPVLGSRWSPRRGTPLDLFEELIYFARVFPHPHLVIEAPLVEVADWRLPLTRPKRRRFSRNYRLSDVTLEELRETRTLRTPADLWRLVDSPDLPQDFTTKDLAETLERSRGSAQRIAYCLRETGAVTALGRSRGGWTYRRTPTRAGRSRRNAA